MRLSQEETLIHHDNYFNASINVTALFACAAICTPVCQLVRGKQRKTGLLCCSKYVLHVLHNAAYHIFIYL